MGVAFLCLARGTRGKEEGARREPQSNIEEENNPKLCSGLLVTAPWSLVTLKDMVPMVVMTCGSAVSYGDGDAEGLTFHSS